MHNLAMDCCEDTIWPNDFQEEREHPCGICKDVHRLYSDDFGNVTWTDESSVQLRRHSKTMRVKIGKERKLTHAQAKHSQSSRLGCHFQKRRDENVHLRSDNESSNLHRDFGA